MIKRFASALILVLLVSCADGPNTWPVLGPVPGHSECLYVDRNGSGQPYDLHIFCERTP